MKLFSEFFEQSDHSNSTKAKTLLLQDYFSHAKPEDASWALYFLLGNRLSRILSGTQLRALVHSLTALPTWLVEECYQQVGDLAETLALLLKPYSQSNDCGAASLSNLIVTELLPLSQLEQSDREKKIAHLWRHSDFKSCFLLNKLLTGGLRVGISTQLVIRALAELAQLPEATIAARLAGKWQPSAASFEKLLSPHSAEEASAVRPVPFLLANPIEGEVPDIGTPNEFQAEWKWDGIRGQLVFSPEASLLWSRGEEDISNSFPDLVSQAAQVLPLNSIIDGEVLAWQDGAPLPFASLQKRINKKNPSKKLQQEIPVRFLAYDLLWLHGEDLREKPFEERRTKLAELLDTHDHSVVRISPEIRFESWQQLAEVRKESRASRAEGIMLKNRSSPYASGRKRGLWWKWKLDPLTLDAVLMYAQRGHGRRAGLFTDYTFGIWSGDALVPFAKAYSGLTDDEFAKVTKYVFANTVEKFGPVRTVKPELVFELGFEGIQESKRHRSGIAVRFPRMLRWRHDKRAADANTLDDAKELLKLVS